MGIELAKPALDVGIVTRDFDRMMGFYNGVLGFPAEAPVTFPGIGRIHRLLVGDSVLRLMEPETVPPATGAPNDSVHSGTGIRYLTLLVQNLDDVLECCHGFGIDAVRPPREVRPGLFITTIQDPDGNWIEMQARVEMGA